MGTTLTAATLAMAAALALNVTPGPDLHLLVSVLASRLATLREELQKLAGQIARPDLKQRKQMQKALARKERLDKKARDDEKRRSTGIQQLRAQPVFVTPTLGLPGTGTTQATRSRALRRFSSTAAAA